MPRHDLDAYETPIHYIAALLAEVQIYGRVYEPCDGQGAISTILRTLPSVRRVFTNDIDPNCPTETHYDSTDKIGAGFSFDWIVTNPPFSSELAILQMMFPHAPNLAFLARLSFLEATADREAFLLEHPPQQIIVLPRYSFRVNDAGKKATDSMTCCWLIWQQDQLPKRTTCWGRDRALVEATYQGLTCNC